MGRIKAAGVENLGIVANPSDINADDLKALYQNAPIQSEETQNKK